MSKSFSSGVAFELDVKQRIQQAVFQPSDEIVKLRFNILDVETEDDEYGSIGIKLIPLFDALTIADSHSQDAFDVVRAVSKEKPEWFGEKESSQPTPPYLVYVDWVDVKASFEETLMAEAALNLALRHVSERYFDGQDLFDMPVAWFKEHTFSIDSVDDPKGRPLHALSEDSTNLSCSVGEAVISFMPNFAPKQLADWSDEDMGRTLALFDEDSTAKNQFGQAFKDERYTDQLAKAALESEDYSVLKVALDEKWGRPLSRETTDAILASNDVEAKRHLIGHMYTVPLKAEDTLSVVGAGDRVLTELAIQRMGYEVGEEPSRFEVYKGAFLAATKSRKNSVKHEAYRALLSFGGEVNGVNLHQQLMEEKSPSFHSMYLRHLLNKEAVFSEAQVSQFIDVGWNTHEASNADVVRFDDTIEILLRAHQEKKIVLSDASVKRIATHPDADHAKEAQKIMETRNEFLANEEAKKLLSSMGVKSQELGMKRTFGG